MPTIEEMGMIIARLDRGGISGLRCANLLPKKDLHNPSVKEVQDAFKIFYNQVKESLESEPKLCYLKDQWNTVVAEHSLCKWARLESVIDKLPVE